MKPMTIKERWIHCQEVIERVANMYGRQGSEIQVMAVSKTRSVQEIKTAREEGLQCFGENRVDEAVEKFAELDEGSYPLYFIGHLQSNKIHRISSRFAGVHSVDSFSLAKKLSQKRASSSLPLEILLQVNTSGEASKSGFRHKNEFIDAAAAIAQLPHINLKGVMTMAPFVDEEKIVRRCFSQCREWAEHIRSEVDGDFILSMGMSSDFTWAIAEGSTLLRIGTSLFGEKA